MKIVALFVCIPLLFLNVPARSTPSIFKKFAALFSCTGAGGKTGSSANSSQVENKRDTLGSASETSQARIVSIRNSQSGEINKINVYFKIDKATGLLNVRVVRDRHATVNFHAGSGLLLSQATGTAACSGCGCVIK